jgi:CRISPR-associated protein Cas1
MLKSVLHFGNPARLSLKEDQLVISRPEKQEITRPLEDIGSLVIDHGEVSLTTPLLTRAAELSILVVFCNRLHLPVAYANPVVGHTLQNLRHRQQWKAGVPLFKQTWAQIVKSKLTNQALALEAIGQEAATLHRLARQVKSGDPENTEAQGARYYFPRMFHDVPDFIRDRDGQYPNNFLNYGYAIVRAGMARALAGAGLCLTLGIFHHNQYNPYALADDCMEPYRAWVDFVVRKIGQKTDAKELLPEIKKEFLGLLHADVIQEDKHSPMMVNMDQFAASLAEVFAGERAPKDLKVPGFGLNEAFNPDV